MDNSNNNKNVQQRIPKMANVNIILNCVKIFDQINIMYLKELLLGTEHAGGHGCRFGPSECHGCHRILLSPLGLLYEQVNTIII
jgi:hypothetical protein